MRFFKYILIFLIIFSLFACNKTKEKEINETEYIETYNFENEDEIQASSIDFNKMQKIIENSSKMDVEVFFAISVLHRKYINAFEEQAQQLDEKMRNDFYSQKRVEFFNTIKYSEKQYNDYVTTHQSELNNNINQYPEIAQYLTSTN